MKICSPASSPKKKPILDVDRLLKIVAEEQARKTHDPVQRPAHYQRFGMEVIDIIRHVLGPEGFRAYCIGNELKYRLRAGDKGDAAQDLAKAMKYREFREGT